MLFHEINKRFQEHADRLSEACARYNLAKSLSSKKEVEKCMEEYRLAIKNSLKERPYTKREREAITISAGQHLLVFPSIKKALTEEQLKSIFPTYK
jgi:hypothetical protein